MHDVNLSTISNFLITQLYNKSKFSFIFCVWDIVMAVSLVFHEFALSILQQPHQLRENFLIMAQHRAFHLLLTLTLTVAIYLCRKLYPRRITPLNDLGISNNLPTIQGNVVIPNEPSY